MSQYPQSELISLPTRQQFPLKIKSVKKDLLIEASKTIGHKLPGRPKRPF